MLKGQCQTGLERAAWCECLSGWRLNGCSNEAPQQVLPMLAPRVRGSILTTGNTSNSCCHLPMDRVRLHIFIRLRSQPSSANATKRSQRRSYNRAWLNYDGQDGSNTWLFVGKPTISSHFSWILEFCAQWWLEMTAGVRFASNHKIESSEQEVA